jgi:hypothetical protein
MALPTPAITLDAFTVLERRTAQGSAPLTDHATQIVNRLLQTASLTPKPSASLRKMLALIDPTLYARAQANAKLEAMRNAPAQALHNGLVTAVAQGLAQQIVSLAPAGLGRVPVDVKNMAVQVTSQGQMTANGQLVQGGVSNLMQLRVGGAPDGSGGGFLTTIDPDGKITPIAWPSPLVNPFPMPADLQDFIVKALKVDCHDLPGSNCVTTSMRDATPGHKLGALRDWLPKLPDQINHDFIGIDGDGNGWKQPSNPVLRFTHPGSLNEGQVNAELAAQSAGPALWSQFTHKGDDWGVYLTLSALDPNSEPWGVPHNPPVLKIEFKPVDSSIWSSILDAVHSVIAAYVHLVEAAVNAVGDLTCDLMTSSAGPLVGAAAGGAAGGVKGMQVGAQGAQVAAAMCKSGSGGAPAPRAVASSVWLYAALGLAGLGAIYYTTQK